jgi:hypothetical protein
MAEPEEAARAFIPPRNNSYLDESRLHDRLDSDLPHSDGEGSRTSRNAGPLHTTSAVPGHRDSSRSTQGSNTATLTSDHPGTTAKGVEGEKGNFEAGADRREREKGDVDDKHAEVDSGNVEGGLDVGRGGGRESGEGEEKGRKGHGRGLTEGDAGQSRFFSVDRTPAMVHDRMHSAESCEMELIVRNG